MNAIEKAKRIIEDGDCRGVSCRGGEEFCPAAGTGTCAAGEDSNVEYFKQWLAANSPEKEIFGWPGNAEEMRKYIGRKVMFKDKWLNDWKGPNILNKVCLDPGSDNSFHVYVYNEGWYRYIKVLPEEPIVEVPMSEAVEIVAKSKGIDAYRVKIKIDN